MRVLLLVMVLVSRWVYADAPSADALKVFELSGIDVLCQQSAPLAQKGLSAEQQESVGQALAPASLCQDLAERLGQQVTPEQLVEVLVLLEQPLAKDFTAAERKVGESEESAQGLLTYRQQLKERPPRQDRYQLVQRLDAASHTTDLATMLRYEAGKTQALMTLLGRGQDIDEQSLSSQTLSQAEKLRASSAEAVESFMLYAYRQMPSDKLQQYAELYEQPAVAQLMSSSLQLLPVIFAERRAQLRPPAASAPATE